MIRNADMYNFTYKCSNHFLDLYHAIIFRQQETFSDTGNLTISLFEQLPYIFFNISPYSMQCSILWNVIKVWGFENISSP